MLSIFVCSIVGIYIVLEYGVVNFPVRAYGLLGRPIGSYFLFKQGHCYIVNVVDIHVITPFRPNRIIADKENQGRSAKGGRGGGEIMPRKKELDWFEWAKKHEVGVVVMVSTLTSVVTSLVIVVLQLM